MVRRVLSGEFLSTVAEAYRDAVRRGQPPLIELTVQFDKPHSTVATWVRMCRQRGILGPAKRRRAGEEPAGYGIESLSDVVSWSDRHGDPWNVQFTMSRDDTGAERVTGIRIFPAVGNHRAMSGQMMRDLPITELKQQAFSGRSELPPPAEAGRSVKQLA